MKDLKAFFDEHSDQYLKTDLPAYRRQMRILDNMYTVCGSSLISHATYEKITFGADPSKFAEKFNDNDIIEMIRYGLIYDDECEALEMYV